MDLKALFLQVPIALDEMQREFFRVGGKHFDLDPKSQHTACFMLAIRALSLLKAAGRMLTVDCFDSYDVLQRAFLETRDLLTTFRLDQEDIRSRVGIWFKDKNKDAWRPQHEACERFLASVGATNTQLAKKWGTFSALSHPTLRAVRNSVAVRAFPMPLQKRLELLEVLDEKMADYTTATVTLFIVMSFELKGWVALGCETARMPAAEKLRIFAPPVVLPLLARVESRGR